MQTFRDDLLDVFFVSKDGAFGFVVTWEEGADGLILRAFRRGKDAGDGRIQRQSAELIATRRASYTPPDSPDSDYGPARLGVLSLQIETDYDNATYVMFGGPPPPGTDEGFAWVAIRPEVRVEEVAAFPYYKGSYMDLLTGDDWLNDYDDPSYWCSPQRQYRPVVGDGSCRTTAVTGG